LGIVYIWRKQRLHSILSNDENASSSSRPMRSASSDNDPSSVCIPLDEDEDAPLPPAASLRFVRSPRELATTAKEPLDGSAEAALADEDGSASAKGAAACGGRGRGNWVSEVGAKSSVVPG